MRALGLGLGCGLLAAIAVVAIGCGGGSKGSSGGQDAAGGGAGDGGSQQVACAGTNLKNKPNGQPCGCGGDCQSGLCVDGVCCNAACAGTCQACNVPGSMGSCSPVPAGQPPRTTSVCPQSAPSTCGLDGTCDGRSGCRKYPSGMVCTPGTCSGASVDGMQVCDGAGQCKPGPATICAPFNCDPSTNKCVSTCEADTDCVAGQKCVAGSCGKKPRGAVCTDNTQCASGFCTDGVCCNVACQGACLSCDLVGREGTCWPIDQGNPDPHGRCTDQGASSCGQTGACDGLGSCALYPRETICVPPACTGDRLDTAGTCDGLGACRPPGVQSCAPYHCANGVCGTSCTTNADCQTGIACMNGSCGLKLNGQYCSVATDCASNFCVDSVCCANACTGGCRSCALPSSLGQCASVPAGYTDPRGTCTDQGAASCGTDGTCDGAGSCRRYRSGTICAPETCAGNVYTPPSQCSDAGACVAPDAIACAPFACNGSKCYAACTVDANCTPGNVCNGNSCGKKTNGAFCSDPSECASGNCAQGVCCGTACAGPCRSCALSSTMGICTNVPTGGPDPAGTCTDQGQASCGTDGKCQAGACQKYAGGTPCANPTCVTTTFTPGATCDGAGTCVAPMASSCFPFGCGAVACKNSCTADADCAPPAVCNDGSCGLKPLAAPCTGDTECLSGICGTGGLCCNARCNTTCMSCAVAGSLGTCTPVVPGGVDPTGTCRDAGAASCGATGFCDGQGGCQRYPAGTQCAPAACQSDGATEALARTCDGAGTCKPASTQSCAPYACNAASCNSACTSDADCIAPAICDPSTNACGDKKRLGQSCGDSSECLSGNFCVDGFCCGTASCPTCQACGVSGSEGICTPVAAGASEPGGRCPPSPPCGNTGLCDGTGHCAAASTLTSCGVASCSGSTFTPVGSCDGNGACQQPSMGCGDYQCGSSGACLTTCASNSDCVGTETCQSGSCTSLTPNGQSCAADADCISTHCAQGICCAQACGGCNSCAVTGNLGACIPVSAGSDPNGACSAASCTGVSTLQLASTCDGNGACAPMPFDCTPFACQAGACRTGCAVPADCATGASCVAGACTP